MASPTAAQTEAAALYEGTVAAGVVAAAGGPQRRGRDRGRGGGPEVPPPCGSQFRSLGGAAPRTPPLPAFVARGRACVEGLPRALPPLSIIIKGADFSPRT